MFDFLGDVARFSFLQHALIGGVLASVAAGVVGTYVVTRRITIVAGSIAHCVLGGMGAAQYFNVVNGWDWLHPLYGAIAAALLAAVIIAGVRMRGGEREDTVIAALWAIGMAIGVVFIKKTPGYNVDLMSYLFGNILLVASEQLWLLVLLDALIVAVGLGFYNQIAAICFDEEFARLRGVNVGAYYVLLLCLIALTVVALVYVTGIIMAIALLTLPAAIAGRYCTSLWAMMVSAALLGIVFTASGLWLSYGLNLPAGATAVLLAGAVYVVAALSAGRRKAA